MYSTADKIWYMLERTRIQAYVKKNKTNKKKKSQNILEKSLHQGPRLYNDLREKKKKKNTDESF